MRFSILGAVSAFIAVAAGAFGAHALRDTLGPELLRVFETGVRYQLVHALALVIVGLSLERRSGGWLRGAGWAFAAGTLLFSGSLYALALTGVRAFGAITPVGGLGFLTGWVLLALAFGSRGRS